METKRPPRVSDPETSRAVSQIYDDLNAIADAVGTGQGQTHRERSSTEGEVGDIKIGRAGLGKYAVMAKTEDGWVESDELSFMDKKSKGSSSSGTGDGITESSLDADGYAKFGNGFIMQWGSITNAADHEFDITFPINFPNECFSVVINRQDGDLKTLAVNAINVTKTKFSINRHDTIDGDITINYVAVGY